MSELAVADTSGAMDTAVADTATETIDNLETVETGADETSDATDTTLDADQIGGNEGLAPGEKPKTYKELRAHYATAAPIVEQYEREKELIEAARGLGPASIVQDLAKLATPPEFASEEEWTPFTRQAVDTFINAYPHLNGRIQPELAWDYLRDPESQVRIVESFFPGATPELLTKLVTAYQAGEITDDDLARTENFTPEVQAKLKAAEAATARVASWEAQQSDRDNSELAQVFIDGTNEVNTSLRAPLAELITEFKLEPLPNDPPEVKALKERAVRNFNTLAQSEANEDAKGKRIWETMTKRVDAIRQTPAWKNATHAQRKVTLQQAIKTAESLYAGELTNRVRAIAAPLAKEAADMIAWKLSQLGSQAQTARVEAGSVATGAVSGNGKRLPMPDETMNPESFQKWIASGGMSIT